MKRIEAVNDFVIKFANVNGSGSASANELFAKAILRMGVPVSPRNIFPSNIQGLPTWYEARVCEHGYQGRRGGIARLYGSLCSTRFSRTWPPDRSWATPAAASAAPAVGYALVPGTARGPCWNRHLPSSKGWS